ncbi:MAG: YhfC family intramembrane metalloprotease [Lachnospiraceae bacterium]|nr:YhfC family intramembrane metalloprotease [Lachnospiraceae bacterium]
MTDYGYVSVLSIIWMILGLLIFTIVPIVLSIVWLVKKKERITTILIGAVWFILFALILEKPIQNVLAFPTALGLPNHALSNFFNANPILLAFVAGLFPGLFEETGRFVAFKTILRKRKNRETSISYGIGHGGIEVVVLLGLTYINYIIYALMINSGLMQTTINQMMEIAPEQVGQLEEIIVMMTTFSGTTLLINVVERIFAVMFHIGASILVFYACKDKSKMWLYPLAIILHTLMDFIAAMVIFKVISISDLGLELIIAILGMAVFFGSFFLLYKRDKN